MSAAGFARAWATTNPENGRAFALAEATPSHGLTAKDYRRMSEESKAYYRAHPEEHPVEREERAFLAERAAKGAPKE